MGKKSPVEDSGNSLFYAYVEVSMKKDAKGAIVPYVSREYPENSTKALPGDLPYFMTPDFNEIKPMSVYEPQEYTVVLTGDSGERLYGFCRRYLPEGIGGRYDVGERLPQVICYVSLQ
ncbi:uncharacterized protein [Blastocystis hominis]|uniref:uDENN domain-containing protein n=1 Tax=Blastocystis hominis TaxID=12968 RepID=D8M277_BLAHO|nr:uncharacterized protein [Blastocystis hominis]CBK22166.2 unnamed protein product [Blastocystis hominis]|eukprot:XP_012896214.1 uncharacterized protein [Blastocystis hominis]